MNKPSSNQFRSNLTATADYISNLQQADGAIPWFADGVTDPWDHIEGVMGLTIGGHFEGAKKGFAWLAKQQRDDGAWFAAYNSQGVADGSRAETNFVAYAATGLWHYFVSTEDQDTLTKYWPMVERAMAFVLAQQAPTGEIYWAVDTAKGTSEDALVTGCSSIHKSLEAAANIADRLGKDGLIYREARRQLGDTIRNKPERFDRTWESKARFSMDWFYPILTGVIRGNAARQRLDARWAEFVEADLGCRCVADQPWVTVAETCELILACLAAERHDAAVRLFKNLQQFQLTDGSWWTGYVFTDKVYWPDERPTWTAAAILIAADALYQMTPAANFFINVSET